MFVLKATHDFQLDLAHSKIASLQEEIEALKADKAEYENLSIEECLENVETASVVIDWEKLNVFSVERMLNDADIDVTTIGYIAPDNSINEWYIHGNMETHEELVREFRKYLASK